MQADNTCSSPFKSWKYKNIFYVPYWFRRLNKGSVRAGLFPNINPILLSIHWNDDHEYEFNHPTKSSVGEIKKQSNNIEEGFSLHETSI